MEGGKKKKHKKPTTPPFPPCRANKRAKMEKDARPGSAYVPKTRKCERGPAPSRPQRGARTRNQPPAGAAPGFRPEARRSLFGSGSSPALTREPSRNLNIRDLRPPAARISGDRKDPVTPLPFSPAAQAPALGAAAPSGAECLAARGGGARLSEPSRENAAPVLLCPALGKGETRGSALPSSRAGGTLQHFELVAACMC